jgi:hypothetical protein
MNTVTYHCRKRLTLPVILGMGILVAFAPMAEAHKIDHRPRITHDFYFAHDSGYAVPRWVRKDRGFHQWFMYSRYRHARRQNWHRLYDLYLYDRQKHRHSHSYYRSGKKHRDYVAPSRRRTH